MRLQVLQEELEAQRARARGESTDAWGVNRTDEDKDVVRATQAQMNCAERPTGGKKYIVSSVSKKNIDPQSSLNWMEMQNKNVRFGRNG